MANIPMWIKKREDPMLGKVIFLGDSYASFIKVSHRGCDELLDEPT